MPSLNFGHYPEYPQADAWGEDAERHLDEDADLALVRLRQLVELLLRVVEAKSAAFLGEGLKDRLDEAGRLRLIPPATKHDLHWVRSKANAALHVSGLAVVGARAWAGDARKALAKTAHAWARVLKIGGFQMRWPPPTTVEAEELRRALTKLDEAEDAAEGRRDTGAAEALLAQVDEARLQRRGVGEPGRDLVALRRASISLALANHLGLPTPLVDHTLISRVLERGEAEAREEVVHLLNRQAVGLLDARELEEALARIDELRDWRAVEGEFRPTMFTELPVRSWQLGALLGTRGLTLAHLGHAEREPTSVREALVCFDEARPLFIESGDRTRQRTYRLAGLVELVRVQGEISDAERAELEAAVRDAPIRALSSARWTPAAFEVALALKAARALGRTPPWLQLLGQILMKVTDPELPGHPYEQLVGGVVLGGPGAPRALRQRLRAAADASGLPGWIAASYLAASEGQRAPEPPERLRVWWDRYDLGTRAEAEGPLSPLPFNYL